MDNTELSSIAMSGESISDLLLRHNIILGELDRTDPSPSTLIERSLTVTVFRVEESYLLQDEEIPFEEQVIQNESLGEGESYLLQQGKNGINQITYRILKENGNEKTRAVFSESILFEPIPEIVMVGITKPFISIPIPGKLIYIIAGNAWLMESNTSSRRPITKSNDLDGRILTISPDGKWLLYSRKNETDYDSINSLWIATLDTEVVEIKELNVSNVIHHAAWVPGKINTITYSTAEPRDTSPGWRANNDLWVITFSEGGSVWRNEVVIEANGGGEYGWWGTEYYWSPDGSTLLFSRPDQIGYVDFQKKILSSLFSQQAYNTHGEWAWESSIGWTPGSNIFFWQQNLSNTAGNGQSFSINTFSLNDKNSIRVFDETGMFSYPSPAPFTTFGHYYLAYLQALQSNQGDTSRYQLIISEQDGSNSRTCFPSNGSSGIDPQDPVWSPSYNQNLQLFIGIILHGNLWFVDVTKCESLQITSDGLISMIDWR